MIPDILKESITIKKEEDSEKYLFELTVPYRFSITEPDKVIPIPFSYLPRGIMYNSIEINEFIEKTILIILREMLKKQPYDLESRINPRLFEDDQKSLDRKVTFRFNAYIVTGKVKLKELEQRTSTLYPFP